ncbi:nucleoside-diphosphate sugar epimerase [Paenibacillus sp. LC231]|uniref:nucleoside-diphosphate sugar epimerase n=1 Tax=unclassified Paenibacillus TaxID=185978 RepID=UPI0008DE74CB|nr:MULTISPECIES: nucleoside-diphosphate sugar epimerase [Paenibacillus]MBX4150297.1 nucleoside-diphosphate sugar epimerase [Paenibacillus lautus]MCT1400097.1 nucleoside-diphosphate sugar epimerase [Paenibacillus sp. p3-SID867]OIA99220.1 nucleoside-diphosphate sugar epimerase [Paenibacillus sp. LC231]
MESKIDDMIAHLSHSQQQLARILEAQRHAAVRMAQIIHSLPEYEFQLAEGPKSSGGQTTQINRSIVSYLNAMADLQQTAADSLEIVLKEMRDQEEE